MLPAMYFYTVSVHMYVCMYVLAIYIYKYECMHEYVCI